jgi:glycine dehydrogenase subunit 2
MLIFEHSSQGRQAGGQAPEGEFSCQIPQEMLRQDQPTLPEVSELQAVRHYTQLSQKNFSIDTNFYPLGSCTMKYNPRACNSLALLPGLVGRHPLSHNNASQGYLSCVYELQEMLKDVTGMKGMSVAGMAGAQGEYAGMAMIRAYHQSRNSTLGVFERQIMQIARIVHDAGGLLYYDGANLNAILGKVRPGDMGFDVIHLNLHKTFSTPHGGGGPGAAAIGVGERLLPFIPIPLAVQQDDQYRWADEKDIPQTIGRLSAFGGNAGVLLRAYVYARLLGRGGMRRVAEYATLNANYLMARLKAAGFDLAFDGRRATHEFIVTMKRQAKELNATAMDYAKRLLDYGHHAPTTYFPLLVPECLLIEPTETEDKATLDNFVEAMIKIDEEAHTDVNILKSAPVSLPVKRLDDVKAARELDLAWKPSS